MIGVILMLLSRSGSNDVDCSDNGSLRRIAYRMDKKYPFPLSDTMTKGKRFTSKPNGRKIPVSLLAVHHQQSERDGFRCRVSLLSEEVKEYDYSTGNCQIDAPHDYVEDYKYKCDVDCLSCKFKCNSVLQYAYHCLNKTANDKTSAKYGFFMFVLSSSCDLDHYISINDEVLSSEDYSERAVSLLYMYGYIEENQYIAFPVRIKEDLDMLINELKEYMDSIKANEYSSGDKKYDGSLFKNQQKVLFGSQGDKAWIRIQGIFCRLLIHLGKESVHSNLDSEQIKLYNLAMDAWIKGIGCTPKDWIRNNPDYVPRKKRKL